jgi:hypothetical protein
VQQGEDPQNGGSLDNRTTLEIAERVGAPPSDALALLGKDFSAYTPSAPYGTPAPQGFDPSRSKLILNSVQGDSFHGPTFWYGDMYASDELSGQRYFLGRVDFGSSPGGDFCDRSADGAKLAFAHTQLTPSGLLTRMQLTWLDLRDMLTIHEVAPELTNIGMLGWSPRLDRLAVFACFGQDTGCGLYLFNPAVENAYQIVLEDVYTMWPALWNPDGTQIAFVNHTPANENALYVVDITTGQVVYQGTFDADRWQVPTNSPINAWGVTFPRGMTGSRCFDAQ